jgi:hypothetical protein
MHLREKHGFFICSVRISERSHDGFVQFFLKAKSSFSRRLRRRWHETIGRLHFDVCLTESLETVVFMMYELKLFCFGHCRPESDFGQTCRFSHLRSSFRNLLDFCFWECSKFIPNVTPWRHDIRYWGFPSTRNSHSSVPSTHVSSVVVTSTCRLYFVLDILFCSCLGGHLSS